MEENQLRQANRVEFPKWKSYFSDVDLTKKIALSVSKVTMEVGANLFNLNR